MLVVIDPYPTSATIVRAKDPAHIIDLRTGVKRRVGLPGRCHAEANVVRFLHVRELGESGAKVG
jgi:hypothetical protein